MTTTPRSLDVALGVSGRILHGAGTAARRARAVLAPAGRLAARPPLLPERLAPAAWLEQLEVEGAHRRATLADEAAKRLDVLVPRVVTEVLRRLTLTELVLRYVDVDSVVAAADLDAAAARLDVGAVVERVDVDAVAARLDVGAVVERVDVDAVATRLDLDTVLDRLDLTALVLDRVDLQAVVEAVLAKVDLAGIAEDVIDQIDLPEIIRESTGSMASDSVWQARMQGVAADEAVSRVVDRILLRRSARTTRAVAEEPPDQQDR